MSSRRERIWTILIILGWAAVFITAVVFGTVHKPPAQWANRTEWVR